MKLSTLRVFMTIASEHSFSRAAAKLGRTQPAVSLALQRLETELGEQLLDRLAVPRSIAELGISKEEFEKAMPELAKNAFDDPSWRSNPRMPLVNEIIELYWSAYHGRRAPQKEGTDAMERKRCGVFASGARPGDQTRLQLAKALVVGRLKTQFGSR